MSKVGTRRRSRSVFGKILLFLIVACLASAFYLYKMEPDALLGRFYEKIYADRLSPVPAVLLNERPAAFSLTFEDWRIQKNNGDWYTPTDKANMLPGDTHDLGARPAAVISSAGDQLTVEVDKQPDQVDLKIIETESEKIILEDYADLSALPLPKQNGNFTYELTLAWNGESKPYQGAYVIKIPVAMNIPPQFIFSKQKLEQGELLEVTVHYANAADIAFEQSIYNKFKWFQQDGFLRGYLPTNYNVKPGIYEIQYGVKSQGTSFTEQIEILPHDYHIQYLTIDPNTEQETRNDKAYAEYNKYYIPVRNQSESFRYYEESFIIPVKGRLTTEFGATRYVNELPTSYRHLGIDIAAPAGTEVKASNRGKVVLARSLILTGNTVMIDHGEGLFSVYHHLLNMSVKTGDIAERGQKIGEVGSTGFSTGPHLHFMISHYLANLEPGYFLVGQPLTYENYKQFLE